MMKETLFKNGIITYDESLRMEMLDMLGMTVDKMGYLIEKGDNGHYIKNNDLSVHIDEFAGAYKNKDGKLVIVKSDIGSLIEMIDKLKE